jgi:RNA polymerase sigma factor (sigma-70 family)
MAGQPGNGKHRPCAAGASQRPDGRERSPDQADSDPLAERIRDGDESAFGELLASLSRRLERLLARKLGRLLKPFEREDVVLDGLERLWEAREAIDPRKPLWALVSAIVHHLAADRLKTAWHRQCQAEESTEPARLQRLAVLESGREPRTSPAQKALRRRVRAAVAKLSERQRTVMLADAVAPEGVAAVRDLAAAMGITENAVRSLRSRGRRNLEQILAPLPPPPRRGGRRAQNQVARQQLRMLTDTRGRITK